VDGHRLSLHDEPRRVEVMIDDEVVASSTATVVLDETGLPPRYYFPRQDVQMNRLEPTPTETVCPFKGQASYWSVSGARGEHRDVAWGYEQPLDSVESIAGRICFYAERAEHRIDGVAQAPPDTPWSPARRADATGS
jgi:uncharacterized protein (DUF427 family)